MAAIWGKAFYNILLAPRCWLHSFLRRGDSGSGFGDPPALMDAQVAKIFRDGLAGDIADNDSAKVGFIKLPCGFDWKEWKRWQIICFRPRSL